MKLNTNVEKMRELVKEGYCTTNFDLFRQGYTKEDIKESGIKPMHMYKDPLDPDGAITVLYDSDHIYRLEDYVKDKQKEE